ncbi:MAG: hypothetical protein KKC68_05555 [Candidatus Thermoplasmatota archaeon]|nr:hypothetical protein [Candidatus Thermoplasmatota archaeon]MBU1941221.1 hypothetical protein [Candidatus Thermoplasmatota archaeon]
MKHQHIHRMIIVGIISLMILASIPIYTSLPIENESNTDEVKILDEFLSGLDEKTHNDIDRLIQAGFGLYLTYSTSQERRAFHLFFPLVLRLIKTRGVFLAAFIVHRTVNARTVVFELSMTGIKIVNTQVGRHLVFILGGGYSSMGRPFYGGSGELFAFSITKPLAIL